MPNKKSLFQRFVEIAACVSLILGIFTVFRSDVDANTRLKVDVENLKKAAPEIEMRLREIEKVQASIVTTQSRIDRVLEHLENRIDKSQ